MITNAAIVALCLELMACTDQIATARVGAQVNHPVPQAAAQCADQPDAAGCASARTHE